MTQFKPILDRVLLKRIEETKDSTIVIPEKYRQQSNKGTVIACGDGVLLGGALYPMPVQPGDEVLFGEYNAEKVSLDGEEYEIVRVQDIRGFRRAS